MTQITGPVLDSSGKPANGHIYMRQTSRFATAGGLVTQARVVIRVTDGNIRTVDGQIVDVPASPSGQGMEIVEELWQDDRTSTPTRARLFVSVPNVSSIEYKTLVADPYLIEPVQAPIYQAPDWAVAALNEKVNNAAGFASAAASSASAASSSASSASSSASSASSSATAAQTARTGAESARDEAIAHVEFLAAPAIEQVAGYVQGVGGEQVRAVLNGTYARRGHLGISPKEFGAVGDGVTDDGAKVLAALTEAAKGGVLDLGGATYYMGTTPLAATLSGPLTIQGGGGVLLWDSGSGITLTQNDAKHTVTVDGVSLYTRAAGSGVALEIIGTGQNATGPNLRPRSRNRGSISRVNIGGAVGTNTDGWAKGLRLVDVMNFTVDAVHVDGYAGPGVAAGSYVSTHGIEMVTDPANAQAVDVALSKCYVFFTKCALDVRGYEGVLVDQCSFIAVETGYRFDAVDAGTPLATFTNGQIAFVDKGVEFIKMNQSVISDSLIYVHPYAATTKPDAVGISLVDTTTTRVTACTFVANTGMLTGVSITGASILNSVESCTFYSTITNPVNLGAGTSKNRVADLVLGSTSQTTVNSAGPVNTVQSEAKPPQLQYAPTGALAQTVDRRAIGSASLSALTSGTMLLNAVWVQAGMVITSATFVSGGSPASGLTRRWFALYDANRNLLRTTADHSEGWLPSTALTLPFATPYTVPYDRLLYVGICEVATTPTVLRGQLGSPTAIALPPVLCGNSSSGLTNAASTPAVGSPLTVSSNLPYAYLS